MKKAVLFLGHGSRALVANEAMYRVMDLVRERSEYEIVEAGFMELCPPTIPEGVDACVRQGAEKIIVVPYFLHMGVHVQRDLPAQIDACRARYLGVEIVFGRHIGFDPRLADILLERVREADAPGFASIRSAERVALAPVILAHDHEHGHAPAGRVAAGQG